MCSALLLLRRGFDSKAGVDQEQTKRKETRTCGKTGNAPGIDSLLPFPPPPRKLGSADYE